MIFLDLRELIPSTQIPSTHPSNSITFLCNGYIILLLLYDFIIQLFCGMCTIIRLINNNFRVSKYSFRVYISLFLGLLSLSIFLNIFLLKINDILLYYLIVTLSDSDNVIYSLPKSPFSFPLISSHNFPTILRTWYVYIYTYILYLPL